MVSPTTLLLLRHGEVEERYQYAQIELLPPQAKLRWLNFTPWRDLA